MITVVCVNWQNYLERGAQYVSRLQSMVSRNLTVPHEFVCLTEQELGTDLQGWWVKMKLAEPGRFTGDVLYLDLDVVITDKIDGMVALLEQDRTKLWMRDDFSYGYRCNRRNLDAYARKLLGGIGCCNSSVMLWHGDMPAPLWERWQAKSATYMAEQHGDQNVISMVLYPDSINFIPDEWVSSHRYGGGGVIKVMHGYPKPHQIELDDVVARHWR